MVGHQTFSDHFQQMSIQGKYNANKGTSYIVLCLECEEKQEVEAKQSVVIHCDQTTHPLLNR